MLTELLTFATGVGSGIGFLVLRSKLAKKQELIKKMGDPFSVPWLYKEWMHLGKKYLGFHCPKCRCLKWNGYLPLCECLEFPREHFHFECKGCEFKAIMRTADDK